MAGAWIQAALEQAPNGENGTSPVSSNVFFLRADNIKVDPGWEPLEEAGKTIGVMGKAPHLGTKDYKPAVEIKGLSCRPSDLMLMLGAFGGTIVSTPGAALVTDPDSDPVPAGCTKHVAGWAATEPKTLQLLAKDAGDKYWQVNGAAVTQIAFSFANGFFLLDVTMLPLYAAEIADPTITPSFDTSTAFRRGDMTLDWLADSARTKDFDLKVSAGVEAEQAFESVSDYPSAIMFKNDESGDPALEGTITKRSMVDADWNSMVNGDQFAATVKLTHREEIGSTGRNAAAWIEMPGCQYVKNSPDDIANVRRRETKIDYEARVDLATASLATITVVNATPTYETYGS